MHPLSPIPIASLVLHYPPEEMTQVNDCLFKMRRTCDVVPSPDADLDGEEEDDDPTRRHAGPDQPEGVGWKETETFLH